MAPRFAALQKDVPSWVRALGVGSFVLAAVYGWVIFNSYPMMYPGYDIWWHLGVMQTGAAYDLSMAEYARWHRAWDRLFGYLEIRDIFERALIIHRVQFFLTILAIGAASYLSLLAVFRDRGYKTLYLFASIVSAGIWLSMHGTHSVAHFGGEDSAITQSWIMWYSVNYQISLPLYFLASAGTLSIVSGAVQSREAWLVGALTLFALAGVVFCHLAELPYYLFNILLLAAIYGGRKQKLIFFLSFLLLLLILQLLIPHISHRVPELPKLLFSGSYSELWQKIIERGDALVNHGGNRSETSWNAFHTTSLIAFALTILAGWLIPDQRLAQARPVIFLMATALLPLALFNQFSAGVLSLVTNQDLAWRFSFASFLYLGIPIMSVGLALYVSSVRSASLAYILGIVPGVLIVIPFGSAVVHSNIDSIVRSLSPVAIHYGLSENNRILLAAISKEIDSTVFVDLPCLDAFSTYYLYYVLAQRKLCLPSTISSLPGAVDSSFVSSPCVCEFDRKSNVFGPKKLPLPAWDVGFKALQ